MKGGRGEGLQLRENPGCNRDQEEQSLKKGRKEGEMPQPFPPDGGDSPADGRQRPSASLSVKGKPGDDDGDGDDLKREKQPQPQPFPSDGGVVLPMTGVSVRQSLPSSSGGSLH